MVQLITSGMIPSGSQLMENWEASLRSGGLTWINMLKDRALTMPADGGIFAEAYTSAGGRQASVNIGDTTALYSLGTLSYGNPITDSSAGDTTHDPNTFTTPANAFDNDGDTFATKTGGAPSLGKTFSDRFIMGVSVKYSVVVKSTSSGTGTWVYRSSILLESFDGTDWTQEAEIYTNSVNSTGMSGGQVVTNTGVLTSSVPIGKNVQGLRIRFFWTNDRFSFQVDPANIYLFEYGGAASNTEIVHDLDLNKIPVNLKSVHFTVDPIGLQPGGGSYLQVKLYNGLEDSGWSTLEKTHGIFEFTAFTNKPEKVSYRLVNNVAIRGVSLQFEGIL